MRGSMSRIFSFATQGWTESEMRPVTEARTRGSGVCWLPHTCNLTTDSIRILLQQSHNLDIGSDEWRMSPSPCNEHQSVGAANALFADEAAGIINQCCDDKNAVSSPTLAGPFSLVDRLDHAACLRRVPPLAVSLGS